MTLGFGIYITEFSSYGETYGSIAGIIILLLWLYFVALILLLSGISLAALAAVRFAARPDDAEARL